MAVPSARAPRAQRPSSHSSDWRLLLVLGMTTDRGMGARSAAEAQSYFITQLRRTIGIEAQLRIRRARELRSRAHGQEMRWGVRYAEDADHGDPVADMADEIHRARSPAHGGGDRR